MINRVILIVLDSVGVGALPDADRFNDAGANTLGHVFEKRGFLDIPHLCTLGLGEILELGCGSPQIHGCYGKMASRSANKDTTSGHWELAGLILDKPFPTYPDGFPPEIIQPFEKEIGRPILGNYPRSGTLILEKLGEAHLKSGSPIVYTSADSVFQIAAHEEIIPLETLYEYCTIARRLLSGPHAVGRVIARPFKGKPGSFERKNGARRDFSLEPPDNTLLDLLIQNGLFTVGVGKIGDLFGHRGLSEERHTNNNQEGMEQTLEAMNEFQGQKGLIFTNLVDFDTVYGHRRNVEGYAKSLEAFDRFIPQLLQALGPADLLIITADHGCDPSFAVHTDHTREYVPLLVYGKAIRQSFSLGIRSTFADCGQTIADLLDIERLAHGESFKKDILDDA